MPRSAFPTLVVPRAAFPHWWGPEQCFPRCWSPGQCLSHCFCLDQWFPCWWRLGQCFPQWWGPVQFDLQWCLDLTGENETVALLTFLFWCYFYQSKQQFIYNEYISRDLSWIFLIDTYQRRWATIAAVGQLYRHWKGHIVHGWTVSSLQNCNSAH